MFLSTREQIAGLAGGFLAVTMITILYSPSVQANPTQFYLCVPGLGCNVVHHLYWGIWGLIAGGSLILLYLVVSDIEEPRLLGWFLLIWGNVLFWDDIVQHFVYGASF